MTRRERIRITPGPMSHSLRGRYLGGPLDGQLAAPGLLWGYRHPDGTTGGVDRALPHYVLRADRTYEYIDPTPGEPA